MRKVLPLIHYDLSASIRRTTNHVNVCELILHAPHHPHIRKCAPHAHYSLPRIRDLEEHINVLPALVSICQLPLVRLHVFRIHSAERVVDRTGMGVHMPDHHGTRRSTLSRVQFRRHEGTRSQAMCAPEGNSKIKTRKAHNIENVHENDEHVRKHKTNLSNCDARWVGQTRIPR